MRFWLIYLLLPLGCTPQEKPSQYCLQQRSKRDSVWLKDDFVMDRPVRFRDETFTLPRIQSYDTVYWYREHGSWGEFDRLCAIYNESQTWKSHLVYQLEFNGYKCERVSSLVAPEMLQKLRANLDSLNVRCLPVVIDTIGNNAVWTTTDSPVYSFFIKEGVHIWCYNWGSHCLPCHESKSKPVQDLFFISRQLMLKPLGLPDSLASRF